MAARLDGRQTNECPLLAEWLHGWAAGWPDGLLA